jgi:hypothetical protein
MSGWGLSCCRERLDRTWPVQEPDMSDFAYWNLARKPDMSGFSGEIGLRKFFDDLHFTNSLNASP